MPIHFKISNNLIVPFGKPKWSIKNIRVAAVSTDATYFESDTPCAHIDKSSREPLRLAQFNEFFPTKHPYVDKYSEALKYIHDSLIENCEVQTDHEREFLRLYFDWIFRVVKYKTHFRTRNDEELAQLMGAWVFWPLMPLPQAHLYARDPFESSLSSFVPDRMFKVDFAFWTGERFIAVEIDGSSHIGSEDHITKDRMLARVGVHVVHILNSEIDKHKRSIVKALLPDEITNPWPDDFSTREPPCTNPLEWVPF